MTLLRQNSELRRHRIWNWTLPAGPTTLPDGRRINCCPMADGCLALCYARQGTYRFSNVKAAHQRNLELVLDRLDEWAEMMGSELQARRFRPNGVPRTIAGVDDWTTEWVESGGAAVRIHDSGDFFADDYTNAWLDIARITPDVLFYAYTKEVSRFRRLVEPIAPVNLRWLYSLGGKEDHLLDLEHDRHADVFPDAGAVSLAGYVDQSESDLLAVLAPSNRIGIPANNIRHLRKRQGDESFGSLQVARHHRRTGADS